MKTLTVIHPFGGHATGHTIDDPEEIAVILAGGNAGHVVATHAAAAPAPATAASEEE